MFWLILVVDGCWVGLCEFGGLVGFLLFVVIGEGLLLVCVVMV